MMMACLENICINVLLKWINYDLWKCIISNDRPLYFIHTLSIYTTYTLIFMALFSVVPSWISMMEDVGLSIFGQYFWETQMGGLEF